MAKYSLFIGRWQPFHEGHKYIIQKVLDEGKSVCIGIRNTPLSDNNPYTLTQRKILIRKIFPDKKRVKIIGLPDIEEVCYGRNVGWGMREIMVPPPIAHISGTVLREKYKEDNL